MTTAWTCNRDGTHKASLSPAIEIVVRAGRKLPEGTEYLIRIAQFTESVVIDGEIDEAKVLAEEKCRALLEDSLGRLHVLMENE